MVKKKTTKTNKKKSNAVGESMKKESSLAWLQGVIQNTSFRIFVIKTLLFFGILFSINLFLLLYFRHTDFFLQHLRIPGQFYFPFLTGLAKYRLLNSLIFTALIFCIYLRDKFGTISVSWTPRKEVLTFGLLSLLVFVSHYVFKYVVQLNVQFFLFYTTPVALMKYVFNLGFVILLAYAVFGKSFLHTLLCRFWKQILIFGAIFIGFYFLIDIFGLIWYPLSSLVTTVMYVMLGATFSDVVMSPGDMTTGPRLGVGDFIVGVSKDCSGIDSMLLFLSIFLFLLVLDWNRFHKKRMAWLFVIGFVGTVLFNILRVYLLMLVGILYSPEFAIDTFHSNIGWILFLGYFFVFWHYGSGWAYKKK